jgi:hypothetical protein
MNQLTGRLPTRGNISSPTNVRVLGNTQDDMNQLISVVGTITYVASANPGTNIATSAWKVKKIDATDANNVYITWANGNANFINPANNLGALSYS